MKDETAINNLRHELFTSLHHINSFVNFGLKAPQKNPIHYFKRIKKGSDHLEKVIRSLVPLLSDELAEKMAKGVSER